MSAEPTLRWEFRPAGLASAHGYLFLPGASAEFPGGAVVFLACPGGVFLVATGVGVVELGARGPTETVGAGGAMETVVASVLAPLLGLAVCDFPAEAAVEGLVDVDGLTGILNTVSALPPVVGVGVGVWG